MLYYIYIIIILYYILFQPLSVQCTHTKKSLQLKKKRESVRMMDVCISD